MGRKGSVGMTLPPPGLGDTGATGRMEPLLAPHPPVSPEKTVSQSQLPPL